MTAGKIHIKLLVSNYWYGFGRDPAETLEEVNMTLWMLLAVAVITVILSMAMNEKTY